jgi:hypothetical protein
VDGVLLVWDRVMERGMGCNCCMLKSVKWPEIPCISTALLENAYNMHI